jgi:hypothetical protein
LADKFSLLAQKSPVLAVVKRRTLNIMPGLPVVPAAPRIVFAGKKVGAVRGFHVS